MDLCFACGDLLCFGVVLWIVVFVLGPWEVLCVLWVRRVDVLGVLRNEVKAQRRGGSGCEVWGKGGVSVFFVLCGLALPWEVLCVLECIWDFGVGFGSCFVFWIVFRCGIW